MATEIVANSWRLVWAEKGLMLIPLVGVIIIAIIGCFAFVVLGINLGETISGLDVSGTTRTTITTIQLEEIFADASATRWTTNFVQGLIGFFIQFATLTAVFRALAGEPYAVGAVYGETWSRIGRVVQFTLVITLLTAAVTVISTLLFSIFPVALAGLLVLALWIAFSVATYFLQAIAVAEDTDIIQAVDRSWRLGRSVLPSLIGGGILLIIFFIVYAIGLAITLFILFPILAAIARALVVLWTLAAIVAFFVYGLSVWVMAAAFQAQLYQRAAARLDGASPFTPEDDDIDEDAFHKPKA